MFYGLQRTPQKTGFELPVGLIFIILACYTFYWAKKRVNFIKNDSIKSVLIGLLSIIVFTILSGLTMGLIQIAVSKYN